ncbi:hypothetical protein ACVWYU_001766 [Pseudomonas sp. TE12234]
MADGEAVNNGESNQLSRIRTTVLDALGEYYADFYFFQ